MTPFFLETPRGRCFSLLFEAARGAAPGGALLYVHPFAEEMNRSRRAVSVAAREFSASGWTVMLVDLSGCGDSAGEFGDFSWADWLDDVACASRWLTGHTGRPIWLWGLRTGCLLAAEAARQADALEGLLLWQPVLTGEQYLQQFLRLKVVNEMLADAQARKRLSDMRRRLESGECVEVSGYALSSLLTEGLSAASLGSVPPSPRAIWLEVGGGGSKLLSEAGTGVLGGWRNAGVAVQADKLAGPPFWMTADTSECPSLIERSLELLGSV